MRRLLVTGFGPYPGVPRNPTTPLVETVAAARLAGVATALLPTTWQVCEEIAARARAYDGVVMFGVAPSARRIRYERVSLPTAGRHPDAAGALPVAAPRYATSRLPVAELAKAARGAGFPVALSHSAGTYICNASYGAALASNPHTLFVHIPLPTGRGALSQAGLARHALWLVAGLAGSAGGQRPQLDLRGW